MALILAVPSMSGLVQAQEDEQLEVGGAVWGTLSTDDPVFPGRGRHKVYEFVVDADGPITISLDSWDFNTLLGVEDSEGYLLDFDDNDGIERNARVTLQDAKAGDRYRILAAASSMLEADAPQVGEFRLYVDRGNPEVLGETALLRAKLLNRSITAQRAQERGQRWTEAYCRLKEGEYGVGLGELVDAEKALTRSAELYHQLYEETTDRNARRWEAEALLNLGRVTYAAGRSDEALEFYVKAGAYFEQAGQGPEVSVSRAQLRVNVGQIREEKGEISKAKEDYETALSFFEDRGDKQSQAWVLGKLGDLFRTQGLLKQAQEMLDRQMPLARELDDPRAISNALGQLGGLLLAQGRWEDARDTFDEWRRWVERHGLSDHLPGAYGNLGVAYNLLGNQSLAAYFLDRALEAAEDSGNLSAQLSAMVNLARTISAMEEFQRAIRLAASTLELAEKKADIVAELGALDVLSYSHRRVGDFDQARAFALLLVRRAQQANRRPEIALGLLELGSIEREAGNYDEADTYLTDAEALYEEIGQPTNHVRNQRAWLLHAQGDSDSALAIFEELATSESNFREQAIHNIVRVGLQSGRPEEALEYSSELLILGHGKGPKRAADNLGLLGQVYWQMGSPLRAMQLWSRGHELHESTKSIWNLGVGHVALGNYDQSIALYQEALSRTDPPESKLATNVGHVHWLLGNLQEGEKYCRRGLELAGNDQNLAWARLNLAAILSKTGQYAESRDHARRAIALEARSWDPPASKRMAHWAVARAALAEGDLKGANAAWQQGEELTLIAHTRARRVDSWGSPHPYLDEDWECLFQDLVAARLMTTEPTGRYSIMTEGFRRASSSKGRGLLGGLVEHRRGERSAQLIGLRKQIRKVRDGRDDALMQFARTIGDETTYQGAEDLREQVTNLQTELDRLTRVLETTHRTDTTPVEGVSPDELQRQILDEQTALIEFADGEDDLYAYVITKSKLEFLHLGSRQTIDEQVELFLSSVSKAGALGNVELVCSSGRELFDRLLAPTLSAAGDDLRRVIVVPTRSLSRLPFEALVVQAPDHATSFGEVQFVLDEYRVVTGPSSILLLEIADMGPRRREGKALLLADPVYASESTEESTREGKKPSIFDGRFGVDPQDLQRLPKTRDEALAIADLLVSSGEVDALQSLQELRRSRSGSLSTQLLDLHLGTEASCTRLEKGLREYTILHLAAHGFVDRDVIQGGAIALSAGPDGEDGLLTIRDVLDLDLDANLVVLSACDSARGELRMGEGVGSLALAFMYAGARSSIASLWQVEDRTAAETMTTFYEKLYDGLSPADALRQAKLAVRRAKGTRGVSLEDHGGSYTESAHPFFWAPFVYIGLPQ